MDLTLDGLASGFPTQDIIDQLLYVEFQPTIENLESQKSDYNVIKDAWRDVNSRVLKLDDLLETLKNEETFTSMKADTSDDSIVTATADPEASEGTYEIVVNNLAKKERVASGNQSLGTELNYSGNFDITVNGNTATISVTTTDTLEDIKTKINDSGLEITATIVDDNLVIESNNTGTSNRIKFTDTDGVLVNDLGFDLDINGYAQNNSLLQEAINADFNINGLNVTRETNEFSDVISNVTINLKGEGTVTLDVSSDTDNAYNAIKSVADQYNSVMDFIDSKMSEGEVLQADATLMRIQMKLRQSFTDIVETGNDIDHISDIGLEMDTDGQLSISRSEFDEAIENNALEVQKFFNSESDIDGYDGLATRLKNYTDLLVKSNGLIPGKQEMYGDQIEEIDEYIEDLQERMEMRRETLLEEFTAMEKAISSMNNQASWLNAQIGSLGMSGGLLGML